jgi:hypothetical protein
MVLERVLHLSCAAEGPDQRMFPMLLYIHPSLFADYTLRKLLNFKKSMDYNDVLRDHLCHFCNIILLFIHRPKKEDYA